MPASPYSDAELDAAIEALTDPQRFREAESMVGVTVGWALAQEPANAKEDRDG